ncbi:hypothetical protein NADFUDRAFT_82396 [Nadsonia fulvescens var. elongata DSM 6958]|uniref:Uncharacterized protein n=1 Tax=Nadsonia fulvescens var. elongata DSM 6958 TaxID=857566 RepID=A0A1E3PN53_9ASCO|nr:hypothetical protein NADFUDRAFT_82396 [Nadsonia fulvescens var. elongata DSM 6958]
MAIIDLPNEILLIIISFLGGPHTSHHTGPTNIGGSSKSPHAQSSYTGKLSTQLESLYSSTGNNFSDLGDTSNAIYEFEPLVESSTNETTDVTFSQFAGEIAPSRYSKSEVGYYSKKNELIRLSSTCQKMRSLIAGLLFRDVSVIRKFHARRISSEHNIDEWSILSQSTRDLLSLITSNQCSVPAFSLSIQCLEIVNLENEFLSRIISCCPNISNLKIYGPSIPTPLLDSKVSDSTLHLKGLTLKLSSYDVMSSLMRSFFLPGISRLELLIDPQELAHNFSQSFRMIRLPGLRQLVIGQSDGFPGIWKPVCEFIGRNNSNLEHLSCRSIRSITSPTRTHISVNPDLVYQNLEEFFYVVSKSSKLKLLQLDLRTLLNYIFRISDFDLLVPYLELVESTIICPFTNEQAKKLLSILPMFTCLQQLSLVYGTHSERVTHNTVIFSLSQLLCKLRHPSLNSVRVFQAWNLIEATRPSWMKQSNINYEPHYLRSETFEIMPDFTLSPINMYDYEGSDSKNGNDGFEDFYKDSTSLFWSSEASLNHLVKFQYKELENENVDKLITKTVSDTSRNANSSGCTSSNPLTKGSTINPRRATTTAQNEKDSLIQLILGTKNASYRGLRD